MSRVFPAWATILAVFVVGTSIYGGYHYYSSIPFWDQWDGYIGFYRDLQSGKYWAFWDQQNEHRIVFSRLLFLLDIDVFGGWNVFTVVANYVLILAVALVIWREYSRGNSNRHSPWLIGGLIIGFLFAWCQNENLKWGFQSAAIAVYLFSLLAFAAYARTEHSGRRVALAIFFSVLAMISMGNGIAAFAVLIGQALLLRRSWKEVGAIAVAGVVAMLAYFHDYLKPIQPVDPSAALVTLIRPKFFAIFLGNPFFFSVQDLRFSAVVGMCFLVVAGILIAVLYFRRRVTPYRAFLAATIGMVVVAAAGATDARWMLGLSFAVASRYTTPTLLGYVALSLLALDVASGRVTRLAIAFVALVALTVIASFQRNAFADTGYQYNWKLAVLGRKVGLDHPKYDSMIFSAAIHDRFARNADFAAAANIGPYGRGWLHDAGIVKFDPARVDTTLCDGFIDKQSDDDIGLVASGWAVARQFRESSLLVVLVDAGGATVGYGVTGANRPDVVSAVHGAPGDSGWTGFAKRGSQPLRAYAYVGGKFCPLAGTPH